MFHKIPQAPIPVSLRRLLTSVSFVGCADVFAADIAERSSECGPRTVFAAIPGTRVHGVDFVDDALARGASALLVDRPLSGVSVPQCVVPNVRKAYAEICSALAGDPSGRLRIAGITGTNGKTTVSWLIRSILQTANRQTGLLGTVEYHDGIDAAPSELTTPDSKTLTAWLAAMVARDTTHAAIELSSHALDQDRTAGTLLDVAVVTNVTQDHFDYHENFERYLASKSRILGHRKRGARAVVNFDDAGSAALCQLVDENELVTYGLRTQARVTAVISEETTAGTDFLLDYAGEKIDITTRLIGRHNVLNCLAAAAVAVEMDIPLDTVARGIAALNTVPGRMERIDCGQSYDVFVDYAHTDDALRRSVDCLKPLTAGRVICVFGAGGDRDRSKRPKLGRAAAAADIAVVTSDNPRTESPEAIIEEILAGFPASRLAVHVDADRASAIHWALREARPGDCVLIAGKGHESEQIIGTERLPFDDRNVVRDWLREAFAGSAGPREKVSA